MAKAKQSEAVQPEDETAEPTSVTPISGPTKQRELEPVTVTYYANGPGLRTVPGRLVSIDADGRACIEVQHNGEPQLISSVIEGNQGITPWYSRSMHTR